MMYPVVRSVIMFAIGLGLIIWSVAQEGTDLPNIIAGGLLIGLVPTDWVMERSKNGTRR